MFNWRLWFHLARRRAMDFYDSIWFYPALLSVGALGLFILTTHIDQGEMLQGVLDADTLPWWVVLFLFSGDADSAQQLLGVVAGMWATIIGISFSVTLVTVQLTATKYIAQVLPLFERNNVNQIVLGTYLSTVIYALLVLRTVRIEEPSFTPYVGVNVAVLLAVVALFLLILFITNVINFVRPQFFLRATVEDALGAIGALKEPEEKVWLEKADPRDEPHRLPPEAVAILAPHKGILTNIAWGPLCQSAFADLQRSPESGLTWTLHLHKRVGDMVDQGEPLGHLVVPEGASRPDRLIGWVRLAHEVQAVRRHREDLDYSVEALAGLTVKGAIQGDLDVAFSGVDALIGLLGPLAKEPEPARTMVLRDNGNSLLIHRPVTDMLAKLIRELTLISEVALAPSLPLRALTEGISDRITTTLTELAEEGEWDAFRRILSRLRPWYQSAFHHMEWVNGMRHIAFHLVELAIRVRELERAGAFDAVLVLMVELREQMEDDAPSREVMREAFARLAREVDLPVGMITLFPEPAGPTGGESLAQPGSDEDTH